MHPKLVWKRNHQKCEVHPELTKNLWDFVLPVTNSTVRFVSYETLVSCNSLSSPLFSEKKWFSDVWKFAVRQKVSNTHRFDADFF